MNSRTCLHNIRRLARVTGCIFFLSAPVLNAADYAIDWNSIGSSGRSQGGSYEISGSIVTPASPKVVGGAYEVFGGFWAIVVAFQTPEAPSLQIVRNGNFLTISWPAGNAGYILEETGSLTAPVVWHSASGVSNNSLTAPLTLGTRFYRLKKQ